MEPETTEGAQSPTVQELIHKHREIRQHLLIVATATRLGLIAAYAIKKTLQDKVPGLTEAEYDELVMAMGKKAEVVAMTDFRLYNLFTDLAAEVAPWLMKQAYLKAYEDIKEREIAAGAGGVVASFEEVISG